MSMGMHRALLSTHSMLMSALLDMHSVLMSSMNCILMCSTAHFFHLAMMVPVAFKYHLGLTVVLSPTPRKPTFHAVVRRNMG
jgi:acyl-coenzyme A synthetase/AMP-(fatty) acid ligase